MDEGSEKQVDDNITNTMAGNIHRVNSYHKLKYMVIVLP